MEFLKNKISRKKFLAIIGGTIIAIPFLSKSVLARVLFRNIDGTITDLSGIGGSGVTRSGSTTDNAIPRWHETDADTIQNSGVLINDNGDILLPTDKKVYFDGGTNYYIQKTGTTVQIVVNGTVAGTFDTE